MSGGADDGTNFRVVSDKAPTSNDTYGVSTGHLIDRSSIMVGERALAATKGGIVLRANQTGTDSKALSLNDNSSSMSNSSVSFAHSLTLFDLKRELGNVVTTGAVIASFQLSAAQGLVVCLCSERRFGSVESFASSTLHGAGKAPDGSSHKQIGEHINTDTVHNLALSIGHFCERFFESRQTEVDRARVDESLTTMTMQLDERNGQLSKANANIAELSKTASDNAMTIAQMEADIKMMEKHLQNEVENRLRGEAAQAMGRALSMWRQTSIQWYFKTWKANYKRLRRHRYIITRVTYKMHRGLLSRVFFFWSTKIAKHLRHNRVVQRCIHRIQHLKLHRCFQTWVESTDESRSIKTKLRQAYTRMSKASLSHAINSWRAKVFLARRARKAIKFWTHRFMSGHFITWVSHVKSTVRLKKVGVRVVKRFQRLKMASHFATWIDWHETVMTNRTTLRRFAAARMSHLNTMKSFQTWAFFTRSRTRMRRRIAGLCRAFENMILASMRPMWKHWVLAVRFSINRIHQLETHAARFVQGRGLRTLRRSFDSFVQYKDSMVKARQIIQRFQNNTNKHGLNALMQRWRKLLPSVMAVVKLQHEAHMELSAAEEKILAFERRIEEADTALIEARQQNLDLKESSDEAARSLRDSLNAAETQMREMHAVGMAERAREIAEMREDLARALQQQDGERKKLETLQELAAKIGGQFQNIKDKIIRTENSQETLSTQLS